MRRDRISRVLLMGCFFFSLVGGAMGQSGRTHTLVTNSQTATKDIYDAAIPPMGETPTHWITMGFHRDLNEAVKIALRDAVGFISKTQGLTLEDAYSLASLAVDLRVTQIVDGNKGIHAMIPKAIFKRGK